MLTVDALHILSSRKWTRKSLRTGTSTFKGMPPSMPEEGLEAGGVVIGGLTRETPPSCSPLGIVG
jgi:hypothetical protein